jgi:hypothetical protein
MKFARILLGAALVGGTVSALAACSSDSSSSTTIPVAPPSMAITAIQSVGGPRWEPGQAACVEVGRDPAATVAVLLDVESFSLRPPGACGGLRQCGTALLRVDPSGDGEAIRVEAPKTTLEVSFDGVDLGSHTFRAELRDQHGDPVQDKDAGAVLFSEVTLDVKEVGGCGGSVPDAGTDADTDAGADADTDAGADADTDAATDASSD